MQIQEHSKEETYHFAGFGWRLVAYIIDAIIIGFFNSLLIHPVLAYAGVKFPTVVPFKVFEMQRENPLLSPLEIMGIGLNDFLIIQLFSILIFWLYFSIMESSKKQATLGKMMFGMVVTDIEGAQVSFAKASGRTLGKYISAITLLVGFIMAAFTEKKQALHDLMANCLVLKKD